MRVPKTRNRSAAKPTDKTGTVNPSRAEQTDATDVRGVVSNPVTSKEVRPPKRPKAKKKVSKPKTASLAVSQTDSLGYRLASLPIANKDKELVANLLHEELGIGDYDRFMREVHRTDVPTPKT